MKESSLAYDFKTHLPIAFTAGSAAQVEFPFEKIWLHKKEHKLKAGDLWFYHVHPGQMLDYSATDLNCMKGFFIAFGGWSPFSIICFENEEMGNLNFTSRTYFYEKEADKVFMLPEMYLEKTDLITLKMLSFKKEE